MFSYPFEGYWKDVGTIESLWQANMDLLADEPPIEMGKGSWRIHSSNLSMPPHYLGPEAKVTRSLVNEGSMVLGQVENSVIFSGVKVARTAVVKNSVIMPFTEIGEGVLVDHAIVAQEAVLQPGTRVVGQPGKIAVVAEREVVSAPQAKS